MLPWKVTVPVPGVNVPPLVQLPPRAKLKLPLAKVEPAMMSRLLVMTVLPCNVLVPDPDILSRL